MRRIWRRRFGKLPVALVTAVPALLCWPAQAAVYQCQSTAGEMLFTDTGCPPGYSVVQVVPEPPVPARPAQERRATDAPNATEQQSSRVAEVEAALLKAELENLRLRSELEQERLRMIEQKLDVMLDSAPWYGAGVWVASQPFARCHGAIDRTPSRKCRSHPKDLTPKPKDLTPKVVRWEGPSCGIIGCTPSIIRRLDRDDAPRPSR